MQNSYIPNIDISSLISSDFNDDSYQNVAKEIKKASEEIGFFTVTGHGISNTKIDKLLSTCRHFFHSPDKEKLKIAPKSGIQIQIQFIEDIFLVLLMEKRV
jgi:isopenicillin N synthase-like dioxygenase